MATTVDYKALAKERMKRRKQKVTIEPQNRDQSPISFRPGGLHQSLGVPQGQKIPDSAFNKALSGQAGTQARKQALFARNVLHRR